MHIKRFEAPTLAVALAQVKAELGEDALILGSRTIRRGRDRFGLLSRTVVEVQAAKERKAGGRSPEASAAPPRDESDGVAVDLGEAAREGRDDHDRFARFEAEMRGELRALHRAIVDLATRDHAPEDAVDDLARRRLEHLGLASATHERLLAGWRDARGHTPGIGLEPFLRDAIEACLTPPRALDPGDVRLIVGAPGAGKTTTLAKLAARNEEGERDVTLVSLDHYRVGASDPLRRYAALLESPFVEASSPSEIAGLAARSAGHEVLVDTAGRGRRDADRLVALEPLRERLADALRVELVVDATARADVLRSQLDRFAGLRPDRIVFTRTDECESVAPIVDLLLDSHCPPASWLGTGQRVPEDLAPAEAGPLVRSLFGAAA